MNSSGEIKVWFPVWKQGTLYFKTVNKDVRVHYDHGITEVSGHKLNWYGTLQTLNVDRLSTLKVGVTYFNPNFDVDCRVRANFENP